jgi:putative phage-type endonuclease
MLPANAKGSLMSGVPALAPVQSIEYVTDYQNRAAWLAARHKGIGASDSPALFNLSPYHSRFSLWTKKTGPTPAEDERSEEDEIEALADPRAERMEWGHLLEGPIAAQYERRTKRKLWSFSDFCIAQHPRIPFMLSTLDRFIIEAPDRKGDGTLEIKNSGDLLAWRDGPPQHYLVQVQHQLAVTGRDYATLVVLLGGNRLRWWDIDRVEGFIEELEHAVVDFWEDVQANRRPAVDGHKATLEALKKLHPLDNGKEVALPPEAATWWQQLGEAKAAIKAAEETKTEAESRIREAFGDATFGVVPGGLRLSLKTIQNPGHTSVVEPYHYRTLRELKGDGPKRSRKKAL